MGPCNSKKHLSTPEYDLPITKKLSSVPSETKEHKFVFKAEISNIKGKKLTIVYINSKKGRLLC